LVSKIYFSSGVGIFGDASDINRSADSFLEKMGITSDFSKESKIVLQKFLDRVPHQEIEKYYAHTNNIELALFFCLTDFDTGSLDSFSLHDCLKLIFNHMSHEKFTLICDVLGGEFEDSMKFLIKFRSDDVSFERNILALEQICMAKGWYSPQMIKHFCERFDAKEIFCQLLEVNPQLCLQMFELEILDETVLKNWDLFDQKKLPAEKIIKQFQLPYSAHLHEQDNVCVDFFLNADLQGLVYLTTLSGPYSLQELIGLYMEYVHAQFDSASFFEAVKFILFRPVFPEYHNWINLGMQKVLSSLGRGNEAQILYKLL